MLKKEIEIKIYPFSQLSPPIRKELRNEVALNFPKVKAFKTRFYYQVPPDYMFLAIKGNRIIAQRYLTNKTRIIDGKRYKIAGIGISINQEFHGMGLGQSLTKSILKFIKDRDYDFVMGTTANSIAKHILKKFGFLELKRQITYKDVETKKIVKEKDWVLVKDFKKGKLIKEIEHSKGPIYLGRGAW